MSLTGKSGIVALWKGIQRYFTATSDPTPIYLGIKERDRWDTSRVVIIDGQFDGSTSHKPMKAGTFEAPWQKKSVNPRELLAWPRIITLSIRAVDPTDPDNEEKQTEATDTLIEQTIRAVWNSVSSYDGGRPIGQGNIEFADATWVVPPVEQAWGKELLLQLVHREVLFDVQQQVRFPVVGTITRELVPQHVQGGTEARVVLANADAGTATIAGLVGLDGSMVGRGLEFSGAAAGGNNGAFRIVAVMNPTQALIANANAVAPDLNNGSIVWAVVP